MSNNIIGLFAATILVGAAMLHPDPCLARTTGLPSEIVIADSDPQAESVTSSAAGEVFFGSIANGNLYRAPIGSKVATRWVTRRAAGLGLVLGLLADDASDTLYVCSSQGEKGTGALVQETSVKALDLRRGRVKATYPFPGGKGVCSDLALDAKGALYATDIAGGRIVKHDPGGRDFYEWATDPSLAGVDGIAIIQDGHVYVNTFMSGFLLRIVVNADGRAGAIVPLATSRPLDRPDGMRSMDANRILLVEQAGRMSVVEISEKSADIRVLRDGLVEPSAVTIVGDSAYVLDAKLSLAARGRAPGPISALRVPLDIGEFGADHDKKRNIP